jgi:Cu2+-exporting ATPase
VIFDKTVTLTRGFLAVSGIAVAPGMSEAGLLALGTGVEANSEHPLPRPSWRKPDVEACPIAGCEL